jgi:outer membrane protein OmpA-like peptidoglycan-associated protein
MKRTLLMASIAFIPTLAFAQPTALPDRPLVVAQAAQPNDQKPDAKQQRQNAQQQRQKAQQERQQQRQNAQQQRQEQQQKAQQQRQEQRQKAQQERQQQRQNAQQPKTAAPQAQPAQKPAAAPQQAPAAAQKQAPAADTKKPTAQDIRQQQRQDAQQQKLDAQKQRQDNRQDRRDDKQDARQERREDKQDARQDRREERRDDKRDARQERREDRRMDAVRAERKERREGNRTVIQERDRTIIRQGNRTIVRHDDDNRFRRAGFNEQVVRRGNRTERVIVRPNGVRIVTVVDSNGRVIRRSRFVNGREYVLFTNRPSSGFNFIINVPPPVVRIPRERYIVEYREAPPPLIYDTLIAQPVMPLERTFSLDEVRYNYDVRARMPRIDIDSVNFETGSWDVLPDQADKLAPIADAMKRAIADNPNEVYMVEGHTDAVGSDDDNLLLSDRRAQAVTEVLTEQFGVPPENMIPQGYGEQNLKVETDGPEVRNRYVSVRRVTPLLAQQQ